MRVAITGASGFIGRALSTALNDRGHTAIPARRAADGPLRWSTESGFEPPDALNDFDAIVHLAGENIAAKRWSPAQKDAIRRSRVEGTRRVVEALAAAERRPKTFVCMSATGYYGDRGSTELVESAGPGEGFLPEVCVAWEREALKAESLEGVRTVRLRLGTVLGEGGGALAKMLPLFKVGLGGKLGRGDQFMSWIHVDDVVRVLVRALDESSMAGAYNLTAPNPVTNATFTKALGNTVHRPTFLPVPNFALKLAFGEMAERLLLEGNRVLPRRLLDDGYAFAFADLEHALSDIAG